MRSLRSLALLLGLSTAASPALTATYSVGLGTGCTHATVQAALDAAAATGSGSAHLIKLPVGELQVANLTVAAPAADIILEGGYGSCSAASLSGITTLRKAAAPASARILEATNPIAEATPRRAIRLRRLTLTGGNHTGALGGGAIYALGKIDLHLQERVSIVDNQAANGGGIYLASFGTGESGARLFLDGGDTTADRPSIVNNRAAGAGTNGNGGGIYALGSFAVTVRNGRIAENEARRNGGGIALVGDGGSLTFNNTTALPIEISDNTAGTDGFDSASGFGGGLYVDGSDVMQVSEEFQVPQIAISGNQANRGGGLYVHGRNNGRAELVFHSTNWIDNVALGWGGAIYTLNGVDLTVRHEQAGGWCLATSLPVRCSRMVGNIAQNQGTPNRPGGAALFLNAHFDTPETATGIARIERTVIEDNIDQGGRAAVAYVGATEILDIEASVIRNNSATGSNSTLVLSRGTNPLLLRYNTILANDVDRLFSAEDQRIDVQGSVIWSPGTILAFLEGSSSIVYNGCLLSHSISQLPTPYSVYTSDPKLDSEFRPRGSSAAIDGCDDHLVTPIDDIALNERGYDVTGVGNQWGRNDLGAFEQRDILFYGGFGTKPDN